MPMINKLLRTLFNLLDFDAVVKKLRGVVHSLDGLHYMCTTWITAIVDHFFCADAVSYAEAQWYFHVIAEELITNAFPNEHR